MTIQNKTCGLCEKLALMQQLWDIGSSEIDGNFSQKPHVLFWIVIYFLYHLVYAIKNERKKFRIFFFEHMMMMINSDREFAF